MDSFTSLVAMSLCALAAATAALLYKTKVWQVFTGNADFWAFQQRYLAVYLLVMGADWLTGPYLFRLYESYGYLHEQIAALFICGYVSSLAFGPALGSLADRYGRQEMCIVFCGVFSASCLLKLSSSFFLLLIGRFLGGISTSLLLSTFESWMVAEHRRHGFPTEWLAKTFALSTLGNGVVACLAGVAANIVADCCGHHPVRPFLLAVLLLSIASMLIRWTWEQDKPSDLVMQEQGQCMASLSHLLRSRKVLLLGGVQACFESAMYVFVFLWTPSLDDSSKHGHPPLGLIFAAFMLALMLGSSIFRMLLEMRHSVMGILKLALAGGAASLSFGVISEDETLLFVAFLWFELCCGIFFPAIGTLRGELVPDDYRTGIMNWFRVPLNLIVVVFLLSVGHIARHVMFLICVGLCMSSLLAHGALDRILAHELSNEECSSVKDAEEGKHLSDNKSAASL